MTLAANALVTVAEAGAHLKLDSSQITADEALLETYIAAATQKVESHTGRVFITRTITETRIGDGTSLLRLNWLPVSSVVSISIDGVALATWTERLSIGRVYYEIGWPLDSEIVVSYIAGYSSTRATAQAAVPGAVAAVLMLVAQMYEDREGVKSQSVSGIGSIEYDPDAWKAKLGGLRIGQLC